MLPQLREIKLIRSFSPKYCEEQKRYNANIKGDILVLVMERMILVDGI